MVPALPCRAVRLYRGRFFQDPVFALEGAGQPQHTAVGRSRLRRRLAIGMVFVEVQSRRCCWLMQKVSILWDQDRHLLLLHDNMKSGAAKLGSIQ